MVYTKEETRKEIIKLIKRCKEGIEKQGINFYNEEQTCFDYVLPLFEILGWSNKNAYDEIDCQSKTGRKRIDYLIRLNGNPVFVLEAKGLNQNLKNNTDFYKQTIYYGDNKSVTWGILTNFKEFVVINCVVQKPSVTLNEVFSLNTFDELNNEKFELLWKFSKQSFENPVGLEELDKKFLGEKRREKIGKRLMSDLKDWRLTLINHIKDHPRLNQFSKEEVEIFEQEIQKFLDRLIFIRTCEDREYEDKKIKELINNKEHEYTLTGGYLLKELRKLFNYYNGRYDSDLFRQGLCDKFHIEDTILLKIIKGMHSHDGIPYDFSQIDSDVLGLIYEGYLGYIISLSKKIKHKESKGKKKEHGIYYTPIYIVNHILQNTLNEYLKTHTKEEIAKIKILDPACGSGSFLIKAYDLLENYYKIKNNSEITYQQKNKILIDNIKGIDLDERACEVARLNLMLKAVKRGQKLPELKNTIKHGNSLVDEETIDKNAFNWKGDFQEGNFDIVIGNPPYVFTRDVEFQDLFKDYVAKNYLNASESISKSHARQSGKVNLYALFLIKGINLLKNHGLFGFIIPNNILRTTTYDIIRKFILDNCKILKIVDLGAGVFEGVTASTIILILEKENDKTKRDKNKVTIYSDINNLSDKKEVEQKGFLDNTSYAFNITLGKEGVDLFEKIEKDTLPLGEITIIHAGGIATGKNKKEMIENHPKNSKYKKMLEGKDIKPYYPQFANRYILYEKKLLYRAREESIFLSPEKIITQRIGGGSNVLVVSYDNQQFYTFNSTNTILPKDKNYPLKYIIALLNSKLINWYYVNKFTNKSELTVNISKTFLEQLPIKIASESQKQTIIDMVNKILSLSKRLFEIGNKITSETKELNDKINSLNKEINRAVYQIYGLKDKDIQIIEKY